MKHSIIKRMTALLLIAVLALGLCACGKSSAETPAANPAPAQAAPAAEGVTVDEVVSLMGCLRRAAELRFRQYLHSTILDEIHAARVELAKKIMLGGKFKIGGLHLRCGYSSPATYRRVVRDVAGVSPRGYLASAQGGRARRGFVV